MKTYLLTWNPARFHWESLAEEAESVRRDGYFVGNWTCARTKSIRPGDRVFLMRQGVEPRGIVASGRVLTPPTPGTIDFDDQRLGGPPTTSTSASTPSWTRRARPSSLARRSSRGCSARSTGTPGPGA